MKIFLGEITFNRDEMIVAGVVAGVLSVNGGVLGGILGGIGAGRSTLMMRCPMRSRRRRSLLTSAGPRARTLDRKRPG